MTQAVSKDELAKIDAMAANSPAYWANLRKIRLQATEFSFANGRDYQIEPMASDHRRLCYMKATQLGITEIEVLKTLHGLIHGKYPRGALYLFPTTDDVNEFSKARFGPLIANNREAIGCYVKIGGKGTDTTSLKRIGNSLLYLRGARLTQSVGSGIEDKESVKLRSIPADVCKFDEADLMDEDVFSKARGRMGDSEVKEEVYLSNPTLPGAGIDALFRKSDQRHWFRRCGCGEWVSAELAFPDCVHVDEKGRGFIACPKCGQNVGPTSHRKGQWVPAKTENSDFMHGYRMSQLMSASNDPLEILNDFNEPPQGNLGDVYRLRLGLPYVAAEDKLTQAVVLECCGDDVMPTHHAGPCAMGVDVGKIKHVVIGCRVGVDRYEILKVIRLSSWNDIHDLAQRYNVKSAVIDARPYEDEARAFQKAERYRIYLCEYSENSIIDADYSDVTGLVRVNRTQIFDRTHRLFSNKAIAIPRQCPEIDEFAKQVCATAKVLETNKKTGTAVYRYRKMGDEHYRNAINYFALAASGCRLARIQPPGIARPSRAIMEYELV